jgi:hypothetical protein
MIGFEPSGCDTDVKVGFGVAADGGGVAFCPTALEELKINFKGSTELSVCNTAE